MPITGLFRILKAHCVKISLLDLIANLTKESILEAEALNKC